MRFLLDENAEARIASYLNSHGHDALRVGQDFPLSIEDAEVLEIAVRESRILITNDRDFGELIYRQQHQHAGVIYLRFPNDANTEEKIRTIEKLLLTHQHQLDKYLTVTPRGVRVRR